MASLLSKFRIDYSALTVIPDITKPAQSTTTNFFNLLIADFQQPENPQDPDSGECCKDKWSQGNTGNTTSFIIQVQF